MSAPSFTYSGNVYTAGVAGTVDFPLTSTTGNAIPYLEPSHIHVYTSADSGATWTELTRPAQWDFASSGTVARLVTGIAAGEWVKVQRITPSLSSYVTFQASSLLTAEQLNDDTLFNTYLNQERFDQGEQSSLVADDAKTAADAATTAATAATSAANAATSTANTALSTANAASSTATQAATDAAAAVSTANQASTDATAAVSTANTASTNASNAVTTANAADAKADQAISAVSTAILYDLVANVAAIPASPANNDAVEVFDSTGIESFTPLAGVPGGFVGSSGLSVRMVYSTAGSTWNWVQYFPNDPETRYLKFSGGTLTGPLRGDNAGSAVAPDFAFDGDPDTGLYSPGANELGLATGGVARLTFDSAGAATFTGSVTLPAGSTVAGYLDTATAASTYQTQAGMSSYVATADIGVTVQAYDATLLKSADIGVTVQGYDATTLRSSDIGVTVQGYDVDTVKRDVAQTFTAPQTFASNVTLNGQSDLRLADSDSSNWVALQAPATVPSNVTWTLPSADGTSGQVLSTSGSGTLSWATPGGGAWELISSITASNSATVEFTSGIDSTFDIYCITYSKIMGSSTGQLFAKYSTDGGSSYLSSNYVYVSNKNEVNQGDTGSGGFYRKNNDSLIQAQQQGGMNSTSEVCGIVYLFHPSVSSPCPSYWSNVRRFFTSASSYQTGCQESWYTYNGNIVVNAIQFAYNSGNIASGTFRLYGIKNS